MKAKFYAKSKEKEEEKTDDFGDIDLEKMAAMFNSEE